MTYNHYKKITIELSSFVVDTDFDPFPGQTSRNLDHWIHMGLETEHNRSTVRHFLAILRFFSLCLIFKHLNVVKTMNKEQYRIKLKIKLLFFNIFGDLDWYYKILDIWVIVVYSIRISLLCFLWESQRRCWKSFIFERSKRKGGFFLKEQLVFPSLQHGGHQLFRGLMWAASPFQGGTWNDTSGWGVHGGWFF